MRVGGLLPEISDRCVSPQVTHTAKRESDLFNHEYDYRLNDLSRIPVNKGTNSRVGWSNTVICMKLSIRASSLFLYVCSLERNSGKVYWMTQSPVTN